MDSMSSQYPEQGPGGPPMRVGGKPASKKGRKKGKRRKEHGRRDFKIPLIAAIVLAVLAGLILFGSLSGGDENLDTYVVRAAGAISAYKVLTPADVEAVPMDLATLVPVGATTNEMIVTGPSAEEAVAALGLDAKVVLRYPVAPGAVLYLNNLTLASTARSEYNIGPDERIVAVAALPARAAGGAIAPGEYVDLIAVSPNYEVATTLLEKVPVLYVDLSQNALEGIYSSQVQEPSKTRSDLLPTDPYPGIYTLAVPMEYTDDIALLQETAILVIVGRADDDGTRIPLDENGRQPQRSTVSVLETFCNPDLLPEPSVGEGVAAGDVVTVATDTIALPKTCIAELLRLQNEIVSSTQDILITGQESPVGAPAPGVGGGVDEGP